MPKQCHNVLRVYNVATGQHEVGVLLANSDKRAWTAATIYDHITEQHGFAPWYLNDNGKGSAYVRFAPEGQRTLLTVARLVTGGKRRTATKYADGDRLNLRPGNLMAKAGHGGVKRKPRKRPQADEFATELRA